MEKEREDKKIVSGGDLQVLVNVMAHRVGPTFGRHDVETRTLRSPGGAHERRFTPAEVYFPPRGGVFKTPRPLHRPTHLPTFPPSAGPTGPLRPLETAAEGTSRRDGGQGDAWRLTAHPRGVPGPPGLCPEIA